MYIIPIYFIATEAVDHNPAGFFAWLQPTIGLRDGKLAICHRFCSEGVKYVIPLNIACLSG